MRFTKLGLDGYGRFTNHVIELHGGLQVIVGPNEQGKTTVRFFIGDMLYGQKRSAQQRLYDDAYDLRRPWSGAEPYGGRLTYTLDDGREIEVQRNFDKRRETTRVFDRTHGQDITGQFEKFRNREPNFAEQHLGLSKAVYLNAATIGHMTLEDLGDEDALTQIRERILALADSSNEAGSADVALKRLGERVGRIGRPVAHSKRPLPSARAHLAALQDEQRQAVGRHRELAELENRRSAVIDERDGLARRRAMLEEELRRLERRDRAVRLEEVERLKVRGDRVTQQCFALSAVREFPIERAPEVQRSANAVTAARAQAERTRLEQAEVHRQLEEERERLGPAADREFAEIPEEAEMELTRLEAAITRLQERLETADRDRAKAAERLAEAQRDLERLPDFSRVGADPVEWLSQLAASFRMAQQARAAERKNLEDMRAALERLRAAVSEPREIFSKFADFPTAARDYEVQARVFEEQRAHLEAKLGHLREVATERKDRAPSVRSWAALMGILLVVSVGAALAFDNRFVYIPASLSGIGLAYFLLEWASVHRGARRTERDLVQTQNDLLGVEKAWAERRHGMEKAVNEAGYGSVRELEALYDRFVQDTAELKALETRVTRQEELAREEHEQVRQLFLRLRDTYGHLGETIDKEEDVQPATGRAISRYQEYRDAKRRLAETRDRPAQLQAQREALTRELEECRRNDVERSLEVRRVMREAGFREEARHTSALSALRAYRIRTAQLRQKRGRIDVLKERADAIDRRLAAEEADLAKQEEAMARILASGGAESLEQWHELAAKAKTYREAWDERTRIEERIESLLRGETLEALRRRVESDAPAPYEAAGNMEDLRAELDSVAEALETLSKQEHALHIGITQRLAGARSMNEIEEESAEVSARVEALDLEMEAASYAAALIEEVARDRHARIAPGMGALAGSYLSEITGGAYRELLISRELRITIRIPQTEHLDDDPERRLSKGTVDQIYLALRLALVRSLSEGGESIPLLLDDPFANYDDERLGHAMTLLRRIGATNQVLLFTCREDVARTAAELQVPVLHL